MDISDREGRTAERSLRHDGSIREFDFSRDSQYLVTISGGTTVRVWDARTGRSLGAPMRLHWERLQPGQPNPGLVAALRELFRDYQRTLASAP